MSKGSLVGLLRGPWEVGWAFVRFVGVLLALVGGGSVRGQLVKGTYI